MGEVDLDRCLTMAAYSGFVVLRQYLSRNPALDLSTAINTVKSIASDTAGLDYIGGAAIYQLVGLSLENKNPQSLLRLVVFQLVEHTRPWWLRLVPYGRDKVRSAIDQDQLQCLREAGLFDPIPDPDVVAWWDKISAIIRGSVDVERMLRAREAERLSFEYERARLQSLMVNLEPEWVSLEDNTLGYDIRSYELCGGQIISRLIEVKNTTSDNIFITRNEWLNAASAESHYCFHVWKLPEKKVVEYPVSAIKPNIPIDQGSGYWENTRIDLSGICK